jgi:molybdate transport system substrate-binding protein
MPVHGLPRKCIPRVGICALILLLNPSQSIADEIRVFSGGAPQAILRSVAPEFEATTGHKVIFTFALVTAIQQKLTAGEKADLILLPIPLIAATEKSVPLRTEGRLPLARVGIGIVVREGASPPDVSTCEAVRKLLVDARSVAFPEPTTPSGAHLASMIEQLGIAEAVKPKLKIRAAIAGGGELVAKGEADVGMYLLSEVQTIQGLAVAGLLPAPLQSFVAYGAAIPTSNTASDPAIAFVKFISDPKKSDAWRREGFELMGGP